MLRFARGFTWRRCAFALAGTVGLAACLTNQVSSSRRSRTLRLSIAGRLEGYALSLTRGYYEAYFATLVFEGLTRLDATGQPAPSLATGWDMGSDGRSYRFRLRRGVRFHDGSPFGPADVVRAWETALREPRTSVRHPWMLDLIEGADALAPGSQTHLAGVRARDDSTLEVRLVRPLSLFPRLIAEPQAFIGAASSDDARPVGTGPWRWLSGRAIGDTILVIRHDAYWGIRPRMDSVMIRVIPDSLLVRAFVAGQVDCTADMTRETRTALAAWSDVRLTRMGPMGLVRIVFNLHKPPLQDVRVRRALGLALDRQRLARETAAGPVIVANGPLPPGVLGADSTRPGIPYDPEGARRLLAETGLAFYGPFRMVLPDNETPEFSSNFSSLLQSYWRAVGLEVVQWTSGDTGSADIDVRVSYPDGTDPDDYLYSRFHSSVAGMGGNKGGFRDSLVDRWLDEGRLAGDTTIRARLMRAASARIDSLAPNLILWYTPVTTASSTRISDCVAGMATSTFVDVDLAATPAPT